MSKEPVALREFTVDGLQHPTFVPIVKALEGMDPQAPVLDLGCGSGAWLQRLAAEGFNNLAGVEYSTSCFKFHDGGRFLEADLMADSTSTRLAEAFGAETFQLATVIEVIEHVSDPERILKLASSMLKPGGWLLISTPNVYSLRVGLRFLFSGKLHFFDINAAQDHTHPLLLGVLQRHILPRYPFNLERIWTYPPGGSRGTRWFARCLTSLLRLFLPDELPGDTVCLLLRKHK